MNKFKGIVTFACFLIIAACTTDKALTTDNQVKSLAIVSANILDGGSKQQTTVALPTNATNKAVTWSVSNTAVAVISESGLLTAVSNGSVIVIATTKDGSNITAESTVTVSGVKAPIVLVSGITINATNITDGKPQQLSLTILPVEASNKTVTWAVSNTTTGTISSDGLVTPKLNGSFTVTATANDGSGKVGEFQITISGMAYTTKVRSESILVWQRNNGGWGKAVPDLNSYNTAQTAAQITSALNSKNSTDTTIDNGHVVTELRWLLADYKATNNPNYLAAAEKAIDYLFLAQYGNGGWPQYYPDKSSYRHQITYNDNAMVNVMNLMWDISKKQKDLEVVNTKYIDKAVTAFNKGIDIVLKTQITNPAGKKTAWCAQHDEVSLLPALARAYELPSVSGSESVGVIRILMLVEQPSAAVKQAVKDAVDWFVSVRVFDISTKQVPDATGPNGYDVVVYSTPGTITWARFYDLDTNLPFFCGRDGIKKATLAEIEIERRAGYSWYGAWATTIIGSEYNAWKTKNGL